MKGYFFNAEPTTDLARYPTGFDREYDADSHAAFFAPLFGSAGVLLAEGQEDPCKVEIVSKEILKVRAGVAYVKGRMVVFDGSETIQTKAGYVVARMNKSMEVRDFQLLVVDAPVQADGDIYDLPLAEVRILGETVQVTDRRVYLTAKVMGGHRHRAEDVDGVSGHKHSAEDIDSGVLNIARVPYQVDADRIIAKILGISFNTELEKSVIHTFNIPFERTLEALPKRIHLVFTHGLEDVGEDPDNIDISGGGEILILDLMVSKDGTHVEGYVDGTYGDNVANGMEPYYTHVRRYYRNLDAGDLASTGVARNFPLKLNCHKANNYRTAFWSGHGGRVFFSFTEGLIVHIGGFQISKSGVSFKMCRSSDASQYYAFTASGYIFN